MKYTTLHSLFRLDIKNLFDQFDRDGNGTIDCKELKAFLVRLNIEATPECLDAMFKAMDKDGKI